MGGKKSLIMNVIVLCLTLTILAASSNASRQHARQLVAPPKENRVGEINLPFEDNPEIILDNRIEDIENEVEDEGFIDSIFGDGAQSRIVEKASDWLVDRASENPGCVERFVCETYRTGETLNGVPYMAYSLSNAAVSFMVADMFDQSIDLKEITRAARHGRTIGSCHNMNCDVIDSQLRNLESIFEIVENFVTTIYNSVAGSLPFKK